VSAPRKSRRAGFSLIELLVSAALLGVVFASAGLVSRTSQGLYRQSSQSSSLETRARQAVDRVVDELGTMVQTLSFPDPVEPAWTETQDFQQALGVVGGALTWGAPERLLLELDDGEAADGNDNDGDERIDECRLVLVRNVGAANEVRTVLCRDVRRYAEREVANGADDNGNGMADELGFWMQRQGDVMRLQLTLEELDDGGRPVVRSVGTSFRIRN
jgi:prepilin-type N-terminal cleavage/methylation domain-containing protein